jgi:hypothetical protein
MFSQGLSGVLVASILLATSISTSFAQNDDSDFKSAAQHQVTAATLAAMQPKWAAALAANVR